MKVGRSTVQRVKDAQTTVNLDYIEVFAKVFQKEPWQLLHPQLGESEPQAALSPSPTLAQALEVVAGALSNADVPTRDLAASMLGNLARNPENHARVAIGLLAMLGNGGPQYETRADTVVQGHDK